MRANRSIGSQRKSSSYSRRDHGFLERRFSAVAPKRAAAPARRAGRAATAAFAVAAVGAGTWRGATGELDLRSGFVRVAWVPPVRRVRILCLVAVRQSSGFVCRTSGRRRTANQSRPGARPDRVLVAQELSLRL